MNRAITTSSRRLIRGIASAAIVAVLALDGTWAAAKEALRIDAWWHGTASAFAISPNGQRIATGGQRNGVQLWSAASGKPAGRWDVATGQVVAIAFAPDGQRLAFSVFTKKKDPLGRIVVIDLKRRSEVFKVDLPKVVGYSLDFSPDGKLLAAGTYGAYGAEGAARLWDADTGAPKATFKEEKKFTSYPAEMVKFSPDGKLLANSAFRKTFQLWDVASGKCLRTFTGHEGQVCGLAFSPDGKLLASSADDDPQVRLWDVATGECKSTFRMKASNAPFAGSPSVTSISFSPDGKTLAGGTLNRDIGLALWDVPSGAMKAVLFEPRQGESVDKLAFFTDGKRLAALTPGAVRVWDVTRYENVAAAQEQFRARDPSVKNLYESLQKNRNDKAIVLDSLSHFEDDHIEWLKDHQAMEKLTLIGAPFARFRVTFLGSGFRHLKDLPRLRQIELSDMRITSLEDLARLDRIKVLAFFGTCEIPAEQWRNLGQMTGLEELDLRGSLITDRGLPGIASLRNLKVLRLKGTFVADHEWHELITTAGVESLKSLAALEVLDMEGRRIGPTAGGYLANLKNLRELDIALTSINDGCAEALAGMSRLETVRLGNLGGKSLAVLAKHPTLKSLSFDGSKVNDFDLQQLAQSKSLRSLAVSGYWMPTNAMSYVRQLAFMSREERLTYALIRLLLAEREIAQDLARQREELPILSYVPPPHYPFGADRPVEASDPAHPQHEEYMWSRQETIGLLVELKQAAADSRARQAAIAAAAMRMAERAFADEPEKLKRMSQIIAPRK
jgi:WD40 repeat protein